MRIASIASSSTGNCIYVGNNNTHILIDAGVSARNIEDGLHKLDVSLDDIDAILVTHEHSDHIKGLGVLERKRTIPIYSANETIEYIKGVKSLGDYDFDCFNPLNDLSSFRINDMIITPHKIYHDAVNPYCYSFESDGKRGAVVTDLGHFEDELIDGLGKLDVIFAEANHDVRMLQLGPYSYQLKQRILSDIGHLSNESCGKFISKLLNDDIKSLMLCHLSDHNNMPELAYESVKVEITLADNKYEGNDFPLYVAPKSELSRIIEF
ncbi:MAG: MBL fold metallo-hydrolase [Lachnospiraceae bacterium]|nr:MBL fold metallo-hydrolase [Lachnospiraceae bacterium]MBP5564853.1 MBL fold metallo-hydrolase [Lachnospiraceae bacterium]